jgi:hypothetical protein
MNKILRKKRWKKTGLKRMGLQDDRRGRGREGRINRHIYHEIISARL